MFTLLILATALFLCIGVALAILLTGGGMLLIVFGDVFVAIFVIVWIIRMIVKKNGKGSK